MALLHAGDRFPQIVMRVAGSEDVTVPDVFAGTYGVVLFSRGASCRPCVEQLRAFQRSQGRFEKAGISVIVLSTDDEATTEALRSKYGLAYAVAHSADPSEIRDRTDAFVTLEPPQLQSTGFVIDPEGDVVVSVYSCGAIGQLLPDDILELLRDAQDDRDRAARKP
ncbi:redoxin domain-containing protein [Microbacterium sp. NPDC058345]|uniref:redoxin domain-containing protein n=1 Tax=Microbacterium sp. NPDC058345 TaxID=3346455 RepID=UPI00364C2C81